MDEYRYTECGLDNVIIKGAHFLSDDAGETCITIPNVNGLHQAIACGIIRRQSGMSGRELRFLRTAMGMTQAELAAMVHRENIAVSRWERGECPIDSNAEAVIRIYAAQKLDLPAGADVRTIAGWCVHTADTPPIIIDGSDPTFYRIAA